MSATWPAVQHAGSRFLSGGAPGHGEASAGDHLQTGYRLWLVGQQLEHGHAPWLDPYTFRPEASPRVNFAGWPYGLPYWPLAALFGPVLAWNLFVLLCYVGAGGLACAWLRELQLPRGAALAGGLAFALAPYRVQQSVGHLLGPVSLLLPLALLAFERGRRGSTAWLAVSAAALASIPLSGQVHLALGAIPFFVLYAVCRSRERRSLAGAGAATLLAVGAGLLVERVSIAGSIEAQGRSLHEVAFYSAEPADFVTRHVRHGPESFVFLGWLLAPLALAGLALLVRDRRRGLALALGLGALVPILLALGTHLPLYSALWHALPPFRYPRVPERLLPIACLCLAGLAAVALSRPRGLLVPALALVLLGADLHVRVYGASVADEGNRAYAALHGAAPGRLLELPVFLPDLHYGSVYLYYDMQARRQRPGGYSTVAPPVAETVARRLERLNCGDWTGDTAGELARLGVRYLAFHRGLFFNNTAIPDRAWFALRGLLAHGFRPLARDESVTMFGPGGGTAPRLPGGPDRVPHYCQGWFGLGRSGRPMSERHAPFWVYGGGSLRLRVAAPEPLAARFRSGGAERRALVGAARTVTLPLGARGWHLVTVDVPRLVQGANRRIGIRLLSVRAG